jgi:aryl-alcohol dehydrogenase-like predicted oxidoreductase
MSDSTSTARELGHSGEYLNPLGFGCMGLVGWYGTRNDAESGATLLEAVESGIRHFDTAASYQLGENERFVGEVLRPLRQRVFIASKCGLGRNAAGAPSSDNRPETIRSSCEASLARLGTDVIDLFYLHRIDPTVPIEESVGAMSDLAAAGKIRHLGLSECSVATLRRAHAVHPIAAVQSEYSLWSREPENGMLATCAELGVSFIAYSPMGRGFLAGNFRRLDELPANDNRRNQPRFQDDAAESNEALVNALRAVGRELGASTAQIAIAWVLARSRRVMTIPGMKTRAHLRDNLRALQLDLSNGQLAAIDAVVSALPVVGERHPPAMMQIIDSEP